MNKENQKREISICFSDGILRQNLCTGLYYVCYLVDESGRRHLHHLLLLVIAQCHGHELNRVDRLIGGWEGTFTLLVLCSLTAFLLPTYCQLTAYLLPTSCITSPSVNVPWWLCSPSAPGCGRRPSSASQSGSSGRGWGRTLSRVKLLHQHPTSVEKVSKHSLDNTTSGIITSKMLKSLGKTANLALWRGCSLLWVFVFVCSLTNLVADLCLPFCPVFSARWWQVKS